MSKPRSAAVSDMRYANRLAAVAALQDGRKQRASRIDSAKRYNRKVGKRVEY